jgi:hypothetical protein
VIFSRGRRGGRHSRDEQPEELAEFADEDLPEEGLPDDALPEDTELDDEAVAEAAQAAPGPYDVTEAPPGVERIDLGALQIPPAEGVEIRVQPNPDGSLQQLVLVHGDSALQLAAFAAPRSAGIWDEVRAEIRASLRKDGATVEEVEGDYGAELKARIPGPEGSVDLRFIGVDGPRWMVRAVYQGPAATDPRAAGPLAACLDGLVVDRGQDAMPVREALPLRLPREITEQVQQAAAAQAPGGPVAPGGLPLSAGAGPGGAAGDRGETPVNGRPGRPGGRRPAQRPRRTR